MHTFKLFYAYAFLRDIWNSLPLVFWVLEQKAADYFVSVNIWQVLFIWIPCERNSIACEGLSVVLYNVNV